MNTLEDRLVEYLNSLESAVPASSLRRVDKVDIRFAQAGLSSYLNPKGAIMQPAQPPENPVPMRVRICNHVTQAKFLHVEDSLGIGKLRLFAGVYRKGQGMDVRGHCYHFISVDDARVVFHALAMAEPNFTYKEYKGTVQPGGKVVSRVLSITSKGDQVYIELKTGPGKKTPTGAVTPDGKTEVEVNVAFKTYEARRLGQTVLSYIQAWDILRLMAHRNLLGKMAAYELVPTTSQNGVNRQPTNGRAQPTRTTPSSTSSQTTPSPNRPVNGKPNPTENKPANAAATTPTTKTSLPGEKPVTRAQYPSNGQTPSANAAATPPMPTANSQRLRHATKCTANGPLPTRPVTRRGPIGRTGQQATPANQAPVMPPLAKGQSPVAAAASVTSAPSVSRPNGVVQQTEQVSPKAIAMAQALYGSDEQPLRYRNGMLVDRANEAEIAAFRQYQVEKKGDPQSRPQLRTYMRQKLAT